MPTTLTRDWRQRNARIAELLEQRTGATVESWKARIGAADLPDEASLRAWLAREGVVGYPQMLLVMEQFGYPAFLVASADELIDAQYRDRRQLRPILDAVLTFAATLGELTVQARKTYISLMTPRRTFAAVQASPIRRVDLGLRLDHQPPTGRLQPAGSTASGRVNLRIGLTSVADVDDEVERWLRKAYDENSRSPR
jgi:hypothetical protein